MIQGIPGLPAFDRKGPPIWYWERAHILNLELSLDHEITRGYGRIFAGVGYVLNGGDGVLVNTPCRDCSPGLARFVPYFGFAFAFGVL